MSILFTTSSPSLFCTSTQTRSTPYTNSTHSLFLSPSFPSILSLLLCLSLSHTYSISYTCMDTQAHATRKEHCITVIDNNVLSNDGKGHRWYRNQRLHLKSIWKLAFLCVSASKVTSSLIKGKKKIFRFHPSLRATWIASNWFDCLKRKSPYAFSIRKQIEFFSENFHFLVRVRSRKFCVWARVCVCVCAREWT